MLKMKLLSSILGAIIGGGAIALIILFQQEIRRFLIFVGTKYFPNRKFSLQNILRRDDTLIEKVKIASIHRACINMANTYTGALIVIERKSSLNLYAETGDILNAKTSSRLLETIFTKNGPLHDGAVIIENDLIVSARSVLPFSNKTELPPYVRIQRIMRDIPATLIEAGCKHSNLRQLVQEKLSKMEQTCKCIRCREYGISIRKRVVKEASFDDIKLYRLDYDASQGNEIFLSYENKKS